MKYLLWKDHLINLSIFSDMSTESGMLEITLPGGNIKKLDIASHPKMIEILKVDLSARPVFLNLVLGVICQFLDSAAKEEQTKKSATILNLWKTLESVEMRTPTIQTNGIQPTA